MQHFESAQASNSQDPPVVLCISGHDPSGGAGIHADIEAVAAQGCHAATVISCLTLQDTQNVSKLVPAPVELFEQQVRLICEDYNVSAVKVGLLGSIEIAASVLRLMNDLFTGSHRVPVVLDPILAAGGGAKLADPHLRQMIIHLLQHTSLLTPNRKEIRVLGDSEDITDAVHHILNKGCRAVLVTGADDSGADLVNNVLYHKGAHFCWQYPKLAGQYHGSGCTLAAAAAARLALGEPLQLALTNAQDYTIETLRRSIHPGRGQFIPRRCIISAS